MHKSDPELVGENRDMGSIQLINIAETCAATRSLGPGLRAVVWVQGCPFHCHACIAPEWTTSRVNRLIHPADLAAELLADPEVTGLTFSGGEPMMQAAGLAVTARIARALRDISIICFTGFTLEQLRDHPPGPGVHDLLGLVDVLIDGPYVDTQNDNLGLRGSSNQRIHYLTERLSSYDLVNEPRRAEIHFGSDYALLVGVPPDGVKKAFEGAIRYANISVLASIGRNE